MKSLVVNIGVLDRLKDLGVDNVSYSSDAVDLLSVGTVP